MTTLSRVAPAPVLVRLSPPGTTYDADSDDDLAKSSDASPPNHTGLDNFYQYLLDVHTPTPSTLSDLDTLYGRNSPLPAFSLSPSPRFPQERSNSPLPVFDVRSRSSSPSVDRNDSLTVGNFLTGSNILHTTTFGNKNPNSDTGSDVLDIPGTPRSKRRDSRSPPTSSANTPASSPGLNQWPANETAFDQEPQAYTAYHPTGFGFYTSGNNYYDGPTGSPNGVNSVGFYNNPLGIYNNALQVYGLAGVGDNASQLRHAAGVDQGAFQVHGTQTQIGLPDTSPPWLNKPNASSFNDGISAQPGPLPTPVFQPHSFNHAVPPNSATDAFPDHSPPQTGADRRRRLKRRKNAKRDSAPSQDLYYCAVPGCGVPLHRNDLVRQHYITVHSKESHLVRCAAAISTTSPSANLDPTTSTIVAATAATAVAPAVPTCVGFICIPHLGPHPPPTVGNDVEKLPSLTNEQIHAAFKVCSAAASKRHVNHVCPICRMAFLEESMLKAHMATAHPGE